MDPVQVDGVSKDQRQERAGWWAYAPAMFFVCVGGLSFYLGFRQPDMWSAHYFVVSAFDGFLMRCLPGTLLDLVGVNRFDYRNIVIFQAFAFMFGGISAFGYFVRKMERNQGLGGWAVLLFISPPLGAYAWSLFGFPEFLALGFFVVALRLQAAGKPWVSAFLIGISFFVHELALFTFIPTYLAVIWLRRPESERGWRALGKCASIYALAGVLAYGVNRVRVVGGLESIMALSLKTRDAFLGRRGEYLHGVFSTDQTQNFRWSPHHPAEFYELLGGFSLFYVVIFLILWRGVGNVYRATVLFGVALLPIALSFVAWDVSRWFFWSAVMSLFLVSEVPAREPLLQVASARSDFRPVSAGAVLAGAVLFFSLTSSFVYFHFPARSLNQAGFTSLLQEYLGFTRARLSER